ncbi:unnamed protein product [Clonostachys rosea f. rosea IK726]|uniref:Stress-response A/B barrel domain-containing protein n=2 Tax=Bionectria ochroleuca TaxID=29856 RepID=A0A0B7JJ41_BIOOC|nr:unnamed protein product [Clonostachys rosea f. rosea IK726]
MKTRSSLACAGVALILLITVFLYNPRHPFTVPFYILSDASGLSSPVTHVAIFKIKPSTRAADIHKLANGMMELKEKCIHPIWEKPYIRSIHGGANHAVETKFGITHSFIIEFDAVEHRDYYLLTDPAYQKFRENVRDYLDDDIISVDFQHGKYT